MEHFVTGVTTRASAKLADANKNTVTKYFRFPREIITSKIDEDFKLVFGGRRKSQFISL